MDQANKKWWERYNKKFNQNANALKGGKEYEEAHANLGKVRNQLMVCSSDWEAVCKEKVDRLNDILEDKDPKNLEEKCHKRCSEYFTTTSMHRYTQCVESSKQYYLSELIGEAAKHSNFLEAMGKNV